MRAVLFKSQERFQKFKESLLFYNVETTILDFDVDDWINYDYSNIDIVIYYPTFKYRSNYHLALLDVYDHLKYIYSLNPNIKMFPDPNVIQFYNDKYKQFLFLSARGYHIPRTIPLLSYKNIENADRFLGYPLVVKNRYGASGSYVYKVNNKKDLENIFRMSCFDFFNVYALKYFTKILFKRRFFYYLLKKRRMNYPFLSQPLLAQEYVSHERDLKLVVGNNEVVEGHWRRKASQEMWKVNIDSGGIGEWSFIPEEAIQVAKRLAKDLKTRWLNLDLFETKNGFLISEFSPVWHHYAYKEKPSFIYKDDYNIKMPLEKSLNLEDMIVKSFLS